MMIPAHIARSIACPHILIPSWDVSGVAASIVSIDALSSASLCGGMRIADCARAAMTRALPIGADASTAPMAERAGVRRKYVAPRGRSAE